MRFNRKWTLLLRVIFVPVLLLALVAPVVLPTSTPVMATGADGSAVILNRTTSIGVVENLIYDLAAVDADPLWVKTGAGSIDTLNDSVGGPLEIRHDFRIGGPTDGHKVWCIEAVVSSERPTPGEEAGARLFARINSDDLGGNPNIYREIQVRFQRDPVNDANNFVGIYNHVDTLVSDTGGNPAKIVLRWDQDSPRFRIRLMRQGDQIVLGAEPSDVFDDDMSSTSVTVDLNDTNFPAQSGISEAKQLGFGNMHPTSNQKSFWESIHITIADSKETLLPYWPPEPPAPTLVHDDKGMGNPQGIDFSADLTGSGYLANDSVTPELDADGTTYYGETRTNPGNEAWDFDGLNCDQTVYGRLVATEVSGRSTTGPDGSTTIPPCEEPSHEVTLDLRLVEIFPGREVAPGVVRGALFVGRATYGGETVRMWSSINYEKGDGVYTVTGGHWILTQNWRNRLYGKVLDGTVTWVDWEGSGTDIGADLEMTLSVNGGTGRFREAEGNGGFSGYLDHEVFPPVVTGEMVLELILP